MNIHVFDRNFNIVGVIDNYVSCIWTPMYYSCGDFELYLDASKEMVNLLKENYYLVRSTDITVADGVVTYDRVMIIKNISLTTSVESGDYISVTGRELKFLLSSRIIWYMTTLLGNVGDCINKVVTQNCISPTDNKRKIPFLTVSAVPDEITEAISKQYTGDNVMTAVEEMCTTYGLGYDVNVVVNNGVVSMPLHIYKGVNRSYAQTDNPVVLFSASYDNLYSTEYILNTEEYANAARVGGEGEGTERKYAHVGTASGLDRYEIFVDAKGISSTDNPDIEPIVANLRSQISDVEAQISDTEDEISDTENNIENIKKDLVAKKTSANDVAKKIADLNTDIARINGEINKLQITIEKCKSDIKTAEAKIEELEKKREAAKKSGDTEAVKKYTADINELKTGISSGNTYIKNTNSQISRLKSERQKDYEKKATYNTELSEINNDISLLNMGYKLNDFVLQSLQVTLKSLNNKLTSLNKQLDKAVKYAYIDLLLEAGADGIAEAAATREFNGEILQDVAYKLGEDYQLGDIVTIINEYGITANSRITSIIESINESGEISMIPSFSAWEV